MDDAADEDGPDDLDGNGIITMMRVKDPAGEWIPVAGEPRLMKKADWSKGEKGVYKLYTEGLDNDGDGEYNEDGPGGVNIGVQFPHLFHPFTAESGPWPGSEPESFALIKFVNEHPEIGLTFVFGSTNFCLNPPRGGRKGEADLNQIKIPENMAGFIGADPNRTYTMAEIMDMVKPLVPEGMQLTESMIASFLGLGAVVNPLPEDLKFYKELSDKYKEFLKKAKLDDKRLEPAQDKDGSFELYAYYQLGLPSFSLDFWTLPEVKEEKKEADITPEKLEKMTNDEFIALGEEKVDAFLKASGAPAQFKAKQLFEGLKAGQMTTKQMAEMMRQMPKPPSRGRDGSQGEGSPRLERQGTRRQGLRRLESLQASDPRRGRDRRRRALHRHDAAGGEDRAAPQGPGALGLRDRGQDGPHPDRQDRGQAARRRGLRRRGLGRERRLPALPDGHGPPEQPEPAGHRHPRRQGFHDRRRQEAEPGPGGRRQQRPAGPLARPRRETGQDRDQGHRHGLAWGDAKTLDLGGAK